MSSNFFADNTPKSGVQLPLHHSDLGASTTSSVGVTVMPPLSSQSPYVQIYIVETYSKGKGFSIYVVYDMD
jgi:hypothetical protein